MDFIVHRPERRARSTTLLAPGCCCCCCCCVHSVGGAAGAIYGSLRRNAPLPESLVTEEQVREEREVSAAHRYAVKIYWLALTIVGFLTIIVSMIVDPKEPILGPGLILGFLPVGQLAASLISAIYILWGPPVRKDLCLRRIGRITVFSFLGAVLGIAGTIISFKML